MMNKITNIMMIEKDIVVEELAADSTRSPKTAKPEGFFVGKLVGLVLGNLLMTGLIVRDG